MNNIKKARLDKKISQKEIALALKVSQPTVSEWESGKKTPIGKNLKQLSEILDVSVDYLLGITDIPTVTPLKSVVINKNVEENREMSEDGKILRFAHLWQGEKLSVLRKENKIYTTKQIEKLSGDIGIPSEIYFMLEQYTYDWNTFLANKITKDNPCAEAIEKIKNFYPDEDFNTHFKEYLTLDEENKFRTKLSKRLNCKIRNNSSIKDVADYFRLDEISIISWMSGERPLNKKKEWIMELNDYLNLGDDIVREYILGQTTDTPKDGTHGN